MPAYPFEIQVLPNPSAHLDAKGRPSCVVAVAGTVDRWIGAVRDHATSDKEGVHVFTFSDDPQRVIVGSPAEDLYYRRAIADGELIPADEASATATGVKWADVKAARDARRKPATAAPAHDEPLPELDVEPHADPSAGTTHRDVTSFGKGG